MRLLIRSYRKLCNKKNNKKKDRNNKIQTLTGRSRKMFEKYIYFTPSEEHMKFLISFRFKIFLNNFTWFTFNTQTIIIMQQL